MTIPESDLAVAPNSDQFLDAFSRIEKLLRRMVDGRRVDSFTFLVREAAKRSATVRRVEQDLLEYADLRNAIVHERGGGFVIAEPAMLVRSRASNGWSGS